MKKLIVSSLSMLCAFTMMAAPHDFAYYRAKTIELLPTLEINPTTVSFVEVSQSPTIEQRKRSPNTIFLNPTTLNLKPHSIALFNCAVEAALGNLPEKDWQQITRFEPTSPIMPVMTALIPLMFITPSILTHRDCSRTGKIIAGLITLAGFAGGSFWYRHTAHQDALRQQIEISSSFENKKCWIQLSLIKLFITNPTTALLAFAGLVPTALQKEKVFREKSSGFGHAIGNIMLFQAFDKITLTLDL